MGSFAGVVVVVRVRVECGYVACMGSLVGGVIVGGGCEVCLMWIFGWFWGRSGIAVVGVWLCGLYG